MSIVYYECFAGRSLYQESGPGSPISPTIHRPATVGSSAVPIIGWPCHLPRANARVVQ